MRRTCACEPYCLLSLWNSSQVLSTCGNVCRYVGRAHAEGRNIWMNGPSIAKHAGSKEQADFLQHARIMVHTYSRAYRSVWSLVCNLFTLCWLVCTSCWSCWLICFLLCGSIVSMKEDGWIMSRPSSQYDMLDDYQSCVRTVPSHNSL